MKLTDTTAKTLAGPPEGRPYVIHYDDDLPGYGLRVTKAGARSFVLNYRVGGAERRMTIGTFKTEARGDGITERQARRLAQGYKEQIKINKRDPVLEDRNERQAPTVADLAARYMEEWAAVKKRVSSQQADKGMIDRIILPALRSKRVAEIQYADIEALHRKTTKASGPFMANRVVSLLSKMFSLAIKWKWRPDNPAKGIERNNEPSRQRPLEPEEIDRLARALDAHPKRASANAVRLLLLTGARRGEVLSATWDQLDLEKGIWTRPSAHTKQKKEHKVPLSAAARLLLSGMLADTGNGRAAPSGPLFPGKAPGQSQSDLKHFWASICAAAGIAGVRVHDLRHTYASVLASAGQSLPIIGQLLGHTNPSTTARYAHLFDDPLRVATERAGAVLAGATRKSGHVVQFPKAAGHE